MRGLRSGFLSSEFWMALGLGLAGYALAAPEHAPWWRVAGGVAIAVAPALRYLGIRFELKQSLLGAPETQP